MYRSVLLAGALALACAVAACRDDGASRATTGPRIVTPVAGTAAPAAAATPAATTPPAAVQRPGGSGTATRRQPAPFDPASFQLRLEPVAAGFDQPLFVTHAGDGSGRLFVVEKGGTIRIVQDGRVLPTPFLDLRAVVRATGSEQGLLGLAFHPRYAENGRFFVAYTANNAPNGDNTVAEYRVSADPNRADAASGRVLLAIADFAPNHNGGMLAFGPDGYLYFGTGDGGGAGDPQRNGQNLRTLLGKLLRLDVDGPTTPYSIPADNPFVGRNDARPEIWAYGLRNPWRFSFDRATGDLWIADVGQNAYEEVDYQPATSRGGENYGWSIMEGAHCFRASQCDTVGLVLPIAEYGHDQGISITGGYVYRGAAYPQLDGAYFFGDYGSGRIWALWRGADGGWQTAELARMNVGISSFGEDEAGEVYLTGLNDGRLYRLTAVAR
jgi:glucose/arabinose dehydrogenase